MNVHTSSSTSVGDHAAAMSAVSNVRRASVGSRGRSAFAAASSSRAALSVAAVEAPGVVEQGACLVGPPRGERSLGSGQQAVSAMLDARERGGALEESHRGGVAASLPRSVGRLLELAGDGVVGSRRRHGKVPGGAVGGLRGVHLSRQRTMHVAALGRGYPVVGE